jgi:hypothetical protein
MILIKEQHKAYWDKLVQVATDLDLNPKVLTETMAIKCNDSELATLIEMAKEG